LGGKSATSGCARLKVEADCPGNFDLPLHKRACCKEGTGAKAGRGERNLMKTKAAVCAAIAVCAFLLAQPFATGLGSTGLEATRHDESKDSGKSGGRLISDREQCRGITKVAEASDDQPPDHLLSPESLAEGRRTYYVHCTLCHGQDGDGAIGVRLTDNETLHGGRFADMLNVVTNGVEMKGMRSYIGILGAERVAQVTAYVYTLKGTKPPSKFNIRFGALIFLAPGMAVLSR
jgi:mono/diheme cytochrome c family protein